MRQPKVRLPAKNMGPEPFRYRSKAAPGHPRRQFPDAVLECLDRLVGGPPFDHAARPHPEGVAQEFAANDAGNGAIGFVHRQVKPTIARDI